MQASCNYIKDREQRIIRLWILHVIFCRSVRGNLLNLYEIGYEQLLERRGHWPGQGNTAEKQLRSFPSALPEPDADIIYP